MIEGVRFFELTKREDERGWLIEAYRTDQLFQEVWPTMAYVSQTLPGVVRGPHLHAQQTDLFCFVGPGDFELHLWQMPWEIGRHEKYIVGESRPVSIIVPPGVLHAYKNISDKPGMVFNAPNKLYAGPGKLYEVDEVRYEYMADQLLSWNLENE